MQTKTWSNLFGSADRMELLKKDRGGVYRLYSKAIYAYDGLGRLVKETDNSGCTKQYQLDDYDRITQTTWPDDGIVKTRYASHTTRAVPVSVTVKDAASERLMGQRSVDGLNRVLGQTIRGRATTQAYDGIEPDPRTVTSPAGDTSRVPTTSLPETDSPSWTVLARRLPIGMISRTHPSCT